MPQSVDHPNQTKIAENLRRTIELTELGLALRQAVVRQQDPAGNTMQKVMHDIRLAKEQAWRRNPS